MGKIFRPFLLITGSVALCFFSSCGNFSLSKPVEPVVELSSESTFCTFPPKEVGLMTKIIFVVDQSGSNGTTDASKERRLEAMQDLYLKYSGNPYVDWGFISFQSSAATPFISNPYFQTNSAVQSAFDQFSANPDTGGTPYKAAIFEVTKALTEDIASQTDEAEANYEIIFLSDGVPSDYSDDQALYDDITTLVKIAEGRIHFSTVYYNVSGSASAGAAERLEQMAQVGYGRFLDASNGGSIDLEGLIVGGVSHEPYLIKDFFVYNLNAALCDDGNIGGDTDADGICDEDEQRYNQIYRTELDSVYGPNIKSFDSKNRFSLDSMYSDMIMLKHILGESLPTCTEAEAQTDTDADLLNDCEERFLTNRSPQGPTLSWTNEMLSKPKYASHTNFDSDGDGILDSLEFMFFKEKGIALDYNSIFKSLFDISYYELMKDHQSKLRPDSSPAYNIKVRQLERNSKGENCYTFSQEKLPLLPVSPISLSQSGSLDLVHSEDENVVLVYYIMVPENNPQGKGVLRYSYQKIKQGKGEPAKQLNLSNDRFDHIFAK